MKEALKLALEALEKTTDTFLDTDGSHGLLEQETIEQAHKAITAIKEALAQEQCQCPECQIKPHTSDCAVHSEPAYPRGGCNCGAQPVAMVLPPIVEPTTKSEPVYLMGSYVGTGEVSSVTLGGVSFAGNGTAGREADVQPTGFFFQMPEKIGSYTSDNPEHQKLDLSLCDAKLVQLPVGEVYGWHGTGKGQPMCRFNASEAEMPVGTKLYTTPPQGIYYTPPQRKPLPPQSPCEMTQAEGKMFKLGWLECEAAHGIKE